MSLSTFWWLMAGAAVVAELLSGTVYLLLIGAGFAAAALATHAGLPLAVQFLVAAGVGVGLVAIWRRVAPTKRRAPADIGLDIGETVHVESWAADHTAAVHYRGAVWTAVPRSRSATMPGPHRVVDMLGNRLVVEPV